MNKDIAAWIGAFVITLLTSSVMAQDENVTSYTQSDGTSVKQIELPDGSIEMHTTDAAGTETITTQHPNGRVEVKTKPKKK